MTSTMLSIRPESTADAAAIFNLTTAAFLNAPHAAHTEAFIVNALRRAGAMSVSLVAEQGGELVGMWPLRRWWCRWHAGLAWAGADFGAA
jgi:predicted N-acetyltransferase YhbS